MRDIKFRAWDPEFAEMLQVDAIVFSPKAILCEIEKPYIYDQYNDLHSIDDVKLMQYTGMHDKNGKEIYEGDVVKQTFHQEQTIRYSEVDEDFTEYDGFHIGRVVIVPSVGVCMKNPYVKVIVDGETKHEGIMNRYKGLVSYRCEIIGNVYENPGLLKEE